MCINCLPENDHGCCRLKMTLACRYAGVKIPRVNARQLDYQLYAVWMEQEGRRIAQCVEACCAVNAKALVIESYLIIDEAEVELNRMYGLEDKRPVSAP
jgi:hypothetical protein